MIEVFVIIFKIPIVIYYSKAMGETAEDKGYSYALFCVLAVISCIIGEGIGSVFGYFFTLTVITAPYNSGLFYYLIQFAFSVSGCLIGALTMYLLIRALSAKESSIDAHIQKGTWKCPACGFKNTYYDKTKCFSCRAPKPQTGNI